MRTATLVDDGHFVVVDGRRWRATDPSIPHTFRAELVRDLMAARRAVAAASRGGGDVVSARRRVSDAKVALGERGEPWWEAPSPSGLRRRIGATIRSLLRARDPASSICPSDVARTIGGGSWRPIVPIVREVAETLVGRAEIVATQGDVTVDVATAKGPLRLRRGRSFEG